MKRTEYLRDVAPPGGGLDRLRGRIKRRRQVHAGFASLAMILVVALLVVERPGAPVETPDAVRSTPLGRAVAAAEISAPEVEGGVVQSATPVNRGALAIGSGPTGVRIYWVMDLGPGTGS